MYVIGTAGHVDHGKSTLVHALTGIDPDRLREEKERGMTIDLGFAWLKLPGGLEVSIIDVPGHERFIKNMLAGVGGIDLALLVVAADEGPMPQTDEHLAILDLLGISRCVVALTKSDLADVDWLDLVKVEVEERLAHTSLAGSPIVPVSAVTGEGLGQLISTVERQLAAIPGKRDVGKPRVPVDRVFTVAGFGTVITGTLIEGSLQVGQEVEILPQERRTRVRGLQSHKRKVDSAPPGSRVAVNLASVAVEELRRGDVVTVPGWLRPTKAVDVRIRAIKDAPKALAHGEAVTFHTGSAETLAKLSLLDVESLQPGQAAWGQLRLAEQVAVAKGDPFIVRIPSPSATVAGGVIVDPHPRRHRRFQTAIVESLSTLEKGSPSDIILQRMPSAAPLDLQALTRKTGLPQEQARAAAELLVANGDLIVLDSARDVEPAARQLDSQSLLISAAGWAALAQKLQAVLAAYHSDYPLRKGMPREEARSRTGLDARSYGRSEARLVATGEVRVEGPFVALASHNVAFTSEQQRGVDSFLATLRDAGTSPPGARELLAKLGLDTEVLATLLDRGAVVEVAPDILFEKGVYEATVQSIVATIRRKGPITVGVVRDLFDTSRKYSLALLEHLDERRVTRRVGDERVLY